uniref:AlNc14C142G7288 protein n=1 Tax=Albugo laibachii Nc14 TaxID=890382 RepID=F0WL99_9STRA|nr:AlNc14C142G7288 [Albugo laibachii Nc14]|eukprot:CCA22061.1 AlNc14C142G7288 [Albugo laibachii Nc14]
MKRSLIFIKAQLHGSNGVYPFVLNWAWISRYHVQLPLPDSWLVCFEVIWSFEVDSEAADSVFDSPDFATGASAIGWVGGGGLGIVCSPLIFLEGELVAGIGDRLLVDAGVDDGPDRITGPSAVVDGGGGVGVDVDGSSTAKAENGSVTATAMDTIWTILEICIGFLSSRKL